jgi:hypothetical protein
VNTKTLQSHVDRLDDALTVWDGRDDDRPQSGVRAAANTAVDAIDALLRDLHAMRTALLSEIRVSDDAAGVRVDALLISLRTKDNPVTTQPYTPTLTGSCAACRADKDRRAPRNARWTRLTGNGAVLHLCDTHKATDEATGQRHDAAGIAAARSRFGGVR